MEAASSNSTLGTRQAATQETVDLQRIAANEEADKVIEDLQSWFSCLLASAATLQPTGALDAGQIKVGNYLKMIRSYILRVSIYSLL